MIPILFIMACAALIAGVTSKEVKKDKIVIVESCNTSTKQKVCEPEYRIK